ncbi:SDR family NAD(P)-dependent oxidoreductase [Rhizobium sp. L43]|uniref:SDR family NAD(P)-dependent oxidoreductase n=1 Tax=Rhizobium sp. L43 TaxID=2035452 RepID=UPI001FE09698|nr:SDR family NAD(P)-dependent oxidoreductase [Rhizobium sp. L43]
MDLNNNTILATGGGTGIDFALVRQLAVRGNRVIICGRQESALAKAKAAIHSFMLSLGHQLKLRASASSR